MGPPSYMRSVVDRNVVMRRIRVLGFRVQTRTHDVCYTKRYTTGWVTSLARWRIRMLHGCSYYTGILLEKLRKTKPGSRYPVFELKFQTIMSGAAYPQSVFGSQSSIQPPTAQSSEFHQ